MLLTPLIVGVAALQSAPGASELAIRMVGMTAVSGFEQAMVDTLLSLIPGSERDRAGSAVVTVGTGMPRRLVVCPLDETGYVVGNLTDNGFLTLRRVGTAPSALFDQWHEGHRVSVWTRAGALPGVVAIPSTHLTRGRSVDLTTAFAVDDAYVDIGAISRSDIQQLGIELLDRVALTKHPHQYGAGQLAAPWAARRSACAALMRVLVADEPRAYGTVVAVFAVESQLRHRGLFTAGSLHGPFHETLLLEYPLPRSAPSEVFGRARSLSLDARYRDTPVETVSLAQVEQLARDLRGWMAGGQ